MVLYVFLSIFSIQRAKVQLFFEFCNIYFTFFIKKMRDYANSPSKISTFMLY